MALPPGGANAFSHYADAVLRLWQGEHVGVRQAEFVVRGGAMAEAQAPAAAAGEALGALAALFVAGGVDWWHHRQDKKPTERSSESPGK